MAVRTSGRHDPAEDRAAALFRQLKTHETDEPRIADPMDRLVARLIDAVVWLAFGVAWTAVVAHFDQLWFPDAAEQAFNSGQTTPVNISVEQIEPALAWAALAGLVLSIYAFEVLPTAWKGRHWSKKRIHLLIVGPDDRPPGLRRATLRWFVWWVPLVAATLLFSATFLTSWGYLFLALQLGALAIPGWIFRDEHHRGLHDRIAGTRVLADR